MYFTFYLLFRRSLRDVERREGPFAEGVVADWASVAASLDEPADRWRSVPDKRRLLKMAIVVQWSPG